MDIQRFLAIENPTDDQIQQAALLLFRLNRNRAMYNSALSNPRGVIRWVVADLNKFLQIRLHGMTNSENVEFERATEHLVSETLSSVPVGVDIDSPSDEGAPVPALRGQRPDHDLLPDHIRALWDDNIERYKRERALHAQLATMIDAEQCDRAELCFQLRSLDNDLRAAYASYDDYVIGSDDDTADVADGDDMSGVDAVRRINRYRTLISRYLKKTEMTDSDRAKMQSAVDFLITHGQVFQSGTLAALTSVGITISAADAQGD